jgi:hypothetical protein
MFTFESPYVDILTYTIAVLSNFQYLISILQLFFHLKRLHAIYFFG